jgi:hypothetical protein
MSWKIAGTPQHYRKRVSEEREKIDTEISWTWRIVDCDPHKLFIHRNGVAIVNIQA